MKKNLNIIQIKGIKGILFVGFIACCLAAGFIYFPGWVCMKIWNFITLYIENMPAIGIIQGILLWGIIAASYFTFRKEKLVVCMRSSDGLSEEELKSVFADIRKHAKEDSIIQSMIKAREAELRLQKLTEQNIITKIESEVHKPVEKNDEKIESK